MSMYKHWRIFDAVMTVAVTAVLTIATLIVIGSPD